MSALVLLPGEGKAVQIGGGGLGVVFKLFGTDTGGGGSRSSSIPSRQEYWLAPPMFITRRMRLPMCWRGKSWHKSAIS